MAAAHGLKRARQALRVLYILDSFPDSNAGTEGQFWLLYRGLDRSRIEPAIVLLRPSAFLQENVRDAPVEVLGIERLLSLRSLWRVVHCAWRARRRGYAVAHIFFNDSAIVFPPWLKLFGLRVIVSRRDLGFWYTRWNLPLLRFVARFVDRVVANCEAVRQVVVRAERYPQRKVSVIYNGLARESGAASGVRRVDFGLSDEAPLIVVVANLRPLKRIADAIVALELVSPSVPDAQLLIVGEDREGTNGPSHRAELESLAATLGVAQRVRFAGKLRDPLPVVRCADLGVLCSETEGLSNVVIEYLFAGKPVVCTAVGGNGELVIEGETGYLVPVGDTRRLAATLLKLLQDGPRRQAFGAAGRVRAATLFAPRRMLEAHMALYESLGACP